MLDMKNVVRFTFLVFNLLIILGCILLMYILLVTSHSIDDRIVSFVRPVEPFDNIDSIIVYGQDDIGWYIGNVFVSSSANDRISNSMVRFNPVTNEIVIPSVDYYGLDSCIEVI